MKKEYLTNEEHYNSLKTDSIFLVNRRKNMHYNDKSKLKDNTKFD